MVADARSHQSIRVIDGLRPEKKTPTGIWRRSGSGSCWLRSGVARRLQKGNATAVRLAYRLVFLSQAQFFGLGYLEAAEFMGLSPQEIEWAIEEYGRCDTDAHYAVVGGCL